MVFTSLIVADGETTTNATTNEPTTGFKMVPSVVFQPANTKITKDADGAIELYIENPEVNDATLHVYVNIYVPPNLYVYGLSGGVGGTGVVTATFDIAPGRHKTVKALIRPTRTGVYILDCTATYYPVGHEELASNISSSYEMIVESTPTPKPPVTPTPEPEPVPVLEAMFVIAAVLGAFYLLMRQK
jgi:hypothetical protein